MRKTYDFIIIGSGIAGLNAALVSAEKKRKVLLVTKKSLTDSNTYFAQGGIAAVLSELDKPEKHVNDTLVAGCFHNDKKAVTYMVKNGPKAIKRLVKLGVPFDKKENMLSLTREGGHSERRIAFVSDFTGRAIENTLAAKARKNPFITILENTFACDLLVKNKTCYGVKILRGKRCENIFGKITVLATGGAGQVYSETTNPDIATADGIGIAFRAGCAFKDMEFIQFHPTVLDLKTQPRFMLSESLRGEGAYLINSKGKRFMKEVSDLAELAPRDIVSRAIFEESKKGQVYLDFRHKESSFLKQRFPQIYTTLKSFGIDLGKDLVPISPAAHYLCGGVKVNLKGQTSVKNLYVFGETACTGVHGANRLASNSLLEAMVFSGQIASAKPAKNLSIPAFEICKFQNLKPSEAKKLSKIKSAARNIMWTYVGIVRTKKGLTEALGEISNLRKKLSSINKKNIAMMELLNILQASSLIAKKALARKHSLGCHFISKTPLNPIGKSRNKFINRLFVNFYFIINFLFQILFEFFFFIVGHIRQYPKPKPFLSRRDFADAQQRGNIAINRIF